MNTNKLKSTMRRLRIFLRRVACVPTCAACGKRLPVFTDQDIRNHSIPCFCEKCLTSFCREKTDMCHNCGRMAAECTCLPRGCKFTQEKVPSLFFYHPSADRTSSKVIFTLKHKKHNDLYLFLGKELSAEIAKVLDKSGISPSSCIFTYIPRSRKSRREHGFDQGRSLSRAVCRELGGKVSLALLTREFGKEQKKLNTKERKKNAERSFFLSSAVYKADGSGNGNNKKPLKGEHVILIDDVMTSGASASRCIGLLKDAGADTVLFASAARCEIAKGRH